MLLRRESPLSEIFQSVWLLTVRMHGRIDDVPDGREWCAKCLLQAVPGCIFSGRPDGGNPLYDWKTQKKPDTNDWIQL